MPCLSNTIPWGKPKGKQRSIFFKALRKLAKEYIDELEGSEVKQKYIYKRIEVLKREARILRLLNRKDLTDIENIFEENFLYVDSDILETFL